MYITYQSKKEVNEKFGRMMIQALYGNRKFFWKDVSKVKGGKVESCSRIKDGEDDLRRIWKDVLRIHMCDFDGVQRSNYFGGELK